MKEYDWHHRRPRSKKGKGDKNLSRVPVKKHCAWHTLFVNYDAYKIAEIINEVWLDMDFEFIVQRRKRR